MRRPRYVIAAIAPDVSLPVWARCFMRSVHPVIDSCLFVVGSPIEAARQLAMAELGFAGSGLLIHDSYQGHGEALNRAFRAVPPSCDVLVIESDCFVLAPAVYINRCFERIDEVGGVLGSRMERIVSRNGPQYGDTYGDGLYPNMLFARRDVFGPAPDWTSRGGGDVGQCIGEELHARGIHTRQEAHLPQCRLTRYPGCIQVDPALFSGPWLHVGCMSVAAREQGGCPEALAAFQACLDMTPGSGDLGKRMVRHIDHCLGAHGTTSEDDRLRYLECLDLCRRALSILDAP